MKEDNKGKSIKINRRRFIKGVGITSLSLVIGCERDDILSYFNEEIDEEINEENGGEKLPPQYGTGADGDPLLYGLGGAIRCLNSSSPTLSHLVIKDCVARGQDGEDATFIFDPPADPDPPLDPLDPLDPLPDPNVPDPNDPSMWAPEDPNGPELPDDPNAPVDGFAGQAGADGLPGEPGADGLEGAPGYTGGNASGGDGGAMYFDANSAPTIILQSQI